VRAQLLRFLVAGAIGFVVDAGVLSLLVWCGAGYFVGRALSFLMAVWVTWRLNRRFTFTGADDTSPWREWWRYLAAMSVGGAINYAIYSGAVLLLPHTAWLPLWSVALGSVGGLGANFVSARWWVFRRRSI
jgi:putative flippase GtrA